MERLDKGIAGWGSNAGYDCTWLTDGRVLLVEYHSTGMVFDSRVFIFDSLYELHELRPEVEIPWALLSTWDPTNGWAWWLPLSYDRYEKPSCIHPCQLARTLRNCWLEIVDEKKVLITDQILEARFSNEPITLSGCVNGAKNKCYNQCPCSKVMSRAIRGITLDPWKDVSINELSVQE